MKLRADVATNALYVVDAFLALKFHPKSRTVPCCSARIQGTANERNIVRTPSARLLMNHRVRGRKSLDPLPCSARASAIQVVEEACSLFAACIPGPSLLATLATDCGPPNLRPADDPKLITIL